MLFLHCLPVRPARCDAPGSLSCFVAIVVTALFVVGRPALSYSQTNQSISGTVQDSVTALPIEGVQVEVVGTGISSVTNPEGRFSLRNVPPGRWRIAAERFGYSLRETGLIDVSEGSFPNILIALPPSPIRLSSQKITHRRGALPTATATRRLTREEIGRFGYRDIPSALEEIPGVRVHGSSETPGGTRVSVGGVSPDRVAVLLDGLPLSGGADGAVDLDQLPLSAVTAIEVSEGAQSSSGGDAAIGGVVNILTHSPTQSQKRDLRATGGEFDVYEAECSGQESVLGWRSEWSVGRRSHGRTFEYQDQDTTAVRGGVESDDWRLYIALAPKATENPRASAFHYSADVGQPGALKQLTPDAINASDRTRVQTQWQSPSRVIPDLSVWYESSREHYTSPISYQSDSEMREVFAGARALKEAPLLGCDLHAEGEFRSRRLEGIDHLRPQLSFGTHRRTEWTLRQRVTRHSIWHGQTITVSAASALDGDNHSKPIFSPRADISWSAPFPVSIRAGWGRSFRRPPLTSLFWKADAFAVGNPELNPERAEEWDIGVSLRVGGLRADSRYFNRDIAGMIIWQRATATGQYTPLNLDRVESYGREDQVEWGTNGGGIRFRYTHAWNASYDQTGAVNYDGEIIPLIPRHTHRLACEGQWGRFNARAGGEWVSERQLRRDNDPGKTLRPFRLFDVFLRTVIRRRAPEFALAVHLNNLTNDRYDLLERYPAPGRSWLIEASLAF